MILSSVILSNAVALAQNAKGIFVLSVSCSLSYNRNKEGCY